MGGGEIWLAGLRPADRQESHSRDEGAVDNRESRGIVQQTGIVLVAQEDLLPGREWTGGSR